MLVVTILYPRTDDSTFDMDYYVGSHMPMFAEVVGEACQGWGAAAVPAGKYAAFGWMSVTSKDAFDAAMAEGGSKVIGDVPNYTNVRPEMIVGEYAGGSQ
jgi:uncharacterized protein (TIGR02118 family)